MSSSIKWYSNFYLKELLPDSRKRSMQTPTPEPQIHSTRHPTPFFLPLHPAPPSWCTPSGLYLRTGDSLGQMILCCGGRPVYCRMFSSSTPRLYQWVASSILSIVETLKCLQAPPKVPQGQRRSQLRTTVCRFPAVIGWLGASSLGPITSTQTNTLAVGLFYSLNALLVAHLESCSSLTKE